MAPPEAAAASGEVESVRQLDSWRPTPRGGDSARSFKYIKPPPTARLYLNLDGIGHGKTPEQAREFSRLQSGKSGGAKSRAAGARPGQDVIISDIRRSEELAKEQKAVLSSQLKVLDRLSARCRGPNEQAQKVMGLFRKCSPDEFGFVAKADFVRTMCDSFGVDKQEAAKLFEVGNDNAANGSSEMNYLQFREAFKRLDRSKTFIPEEHRPILNRDAAPKPTSSKDLAKVKPASFQSMSQEQRNEYRQRNRVHALLEHGRKKLQQQFNKRMEPIDESGASHGAAEGSEVYVRTKLTFPEVAKFLSDHDVQVSAETVRELYQASPRESGITFSQLNRRTADYFSKLEGAEPATEAARNMELKGQFLGCRALHTEVKAASPARVSDFLAHHHTPHDVDAAEGTTKKVGAGRKRRGGRPRAGAARQDSARSAAREEHLWKARWTDKTMPAKPRTSCGDSIKAAVRGVSDKMQQGNGKILEWNDRETLANHPLGSSSSRYESARFESARYETSRLETGRLETGRSSMTSSAPYLSTPFATDRDY